MSTLSSLLCNSRANPLILIRRSLNRIEVKNTKYAQIICYLIPPSCPFAREIKLLGRKLFQIPALCHFNPLYDDLILLRFKALSFLDQENFN